MLRLGAVATINGGDVEGGRRVEVGVLKAGVPDAAEAFAVVAVAHLGDDGDGIGAVGVGADEVDHGGLAGETTGGRRLGLRVEGVGKSERPERAGDRDGIAGRTRSGDWRRCS